MKRTKIIDVLNSTAYGKDVCVKGWVRSHRGNKNVDFIALNDGSTIKNVQVVVDPTKFGEELLKQITTGACISATGTLVESQGAGQASEIQASELLVYGLCDSTYPMQKKGQTFEYKDGIPSIINNSEIKDILKATSVNDTWTTDVANIPSGNKIQAGYGKIDALAGLYKILGTTAIETIGADGHREATPATMYSVDAPVYNMMGQRVSKSQKGLVIYKGHKYLNK